MSKKQHYYFAIIAIHSIKISKQEKNCVSVEKKLWRDGRMTNRRLSEMWRNNHNELCILCFDFYMI